MEWRHFVNLFIERPSYVTLQMVFVLFHNYVTLDNQPRQVSVVGLQCNRDAADASSGSVDVLRIQSSLRSQFVRTTYVSQRSTAGLRVHLF